MTRREALTVLAVAVVLVVGSVLVLAGPVGGLACGVALGMVALLVPERVPPERKERP